MILNVVAILFLWGSIGTVSAVVIAIKEPENLTKVQINPASIVSILETSLVNLPNVTLADRNNQKEIDQEFKFQRTGKVSQESEQESGKMAGAKLLIFPKITYANAVDRSVHFSNFTEKKAELTLELQIKLIDVTRGTLIYSKNFDVDHTYSSEGSNYWTTLVRIAANKLAGDQTFQYKIGALKPAPATVLDRVNFKVAPDATVFANGSYISTGDGFGSFKDGTVINVKVIRDGYRNWNYPVRVSPGMVVKAVNKKIIKAVAPAHDDTMKTVKKVTMTVQKAIK